MARSAAVLPDGSRITDYISLGVVTKTFPAELVREVLHDTGKSSIRERALPAHVVVYYVIALSIFMQVSCREVLRCLMEGIDWLSKSKINIHVAGKSGISQARSRMGSGPIKELHDRVVKPITTIKTKGAWYKSWHLISLDGSSLDVADTKENQGAFERSHNIRGGSAFPKIRFVSLVENGTHVLFGTQMDSYGVGEVTLAEHVIKHLDKGMLCFADRGFFSYHLFRDAGSTGADLLWRVKVRFKTPPTKRLEDGSYLCDIYPTTSDRRRSRHAITIRVIEYKLIGVANSEPSYKLLTTILDPKQAPADELAKLYHERWEIENSLDELKTHLRGSRIVMRSKTPDLVRQEFYGLMMAHYAVRGLMHEAAITAEIDPDTLSFVHAVRVIRRKLPIYGITPPSEEASSSQQGSTGDS